MAHKDKIPGGKADKKNPKDFNPQALAQGIKIEMEHTKDKKIAQEIAMDHLTEDPKYYEKLKQVEKAELSKALDPAAEVSAKRDKIKNVIRKLKRKRKQMLGQVHIPGITKPQKRKKGKVKEAEHKKPEKASTPKRPTKQVLVGPKGGQYIQTSSGKKKYADKVKKALETFVETEQELFVKNFRRKSE
jgi:hypothetical protein